MDEQTYGEKFKELQAEYEKIQSQLRTLAWEMMPDSVRELLCGEKGLYHGARGQALEWFIAPRRQFGGRSLAQAIADGEAEKVERFIAQGIHGIYT